MKNLITLVADDGLNSTGEDGSNPYFAIRKVSKRLHTAYLISSKIYLSAYPTVITGLGRRKPAVTQAIVNAVNNGNTYTKLS
jgi:hypothetical protein